MLLRFKISGGANQVIVSQRFLETTYYKHYQDAGKPASLAAASGLV
jgi:hypothetical protein